MTSESRSSGPGRSFVEEARRAQIVKCTIDIISTHGYAQTSLALIAERAGISKGVISYHFAGKEELIEQVFKEVMTLAAKEVLPLVEKQPRAKDKLRVYIEGSIAFMGTHGPHSIVLLEIWNGLRTTEGRPFFDASSYEPGLEFLQGIFRQGQSEGEFRRFAPRVMAVTVRSAIDGILVQRITYGDKVDLEESARELVALFDAATARPTRASKRPRTSP
ncbi:TetR/AcrR family transcriptional regulator [Archangium violaceum]|uniref:TetR/AcrR family transcriptional regulator n=1 Tax=Archangium violaceum TaxID=83451 RepID=UPI002B3173D1|nr:TetR/AcrR family transcriptional regulator [Archangium gephyra]